MADGLLPTPSAVMGDGASRGPVARSRCSQQLQELEEWQWAAKTLQLPHWREAELCKVQELRQRQLAKEMARPSRSCRAARSKIQDNLSKLRWDTGDYHPACIHYLQKLLQLERRLFINSILEQLKSELPTSHCRAWTKALLDTRAIRRCRAPAPLMKTGPGPWQQPAARLSLGLSSWHYRRDLLKATELGGRQHSRL